MHLFNKNQIKKTSIMKINYSKAYKAISNSEKLPRKVKKAILGLLISKSKLSEWDKVYPQEYVVIADYPDSNFKIGDILRFRGITWGCNEPQKFCDNPEKYPNIFK